MAAPITTKKSFKDRLAALVEEYGRIAFGIYIGVGALTYLGLVIAIKAGFDFGDRVGSGASTYVAAWLIYKLTMPFRVGATLLLTPLVARFWPKRKRATDLADTSAAFAAKSDDGSQVVEPPR